MNTTIKQLEEAYHHAERAYALATLFHQPEHIRKRIALLQRLTAQTIREVNKTSKPTSKRQYSGVF